MNTVKSLGLVGVAATALFAAQAFATPTCSNAPATGAPTQGAPVCIAPQGLDHPGTGLQDLLNGMTKTGTPQIDVYNDQASPSSYWKVGFSGTSVNGIVFEIAGNANINSFGIFDPRDPGTMLQIFGGPDVVGAKRILDNAGNVFCLGFCSDSSSTRVTFGGDTFGYYLQSGDNLFFSDPSRNSDGMTHMVAYQGNGQTLFTVNGRTGKFLSNEWLLAWEDLLADQSDLDYNDFVVTVESVYPVPEPAALGMFGFGVLMIGGFAAMRRRRALEA